MASEQTSGVCPHGIVGFCPDCPPAFLSTDGEMVAAPTARVVGRTVYRYHPDGSMDWCTEHWTRRGAHRAAKEYERTGRVKGFTS